MAIPEEYDFEKLAREITIERLKNIANAPAAAGQIARKIIISGVQSTRLRQDPRLTVMGVCRGVMAGMLLIDKDLVAASLEILKSMSQLSQEIHLDPTDMMTWAMEGVAAVAHMGPPDLKIQLGEAIEENFMGAGAIFDALCEKVGADRHS